MYGLILHIFFKVVMRYVTENGRISFKTCGLLRQISRRCGTVNFHSTIKQH